MICHDGKKQAHPQKNIGLVSLTEKRSQILQGNMTYEKNGKKGT
jgi:hypothetical protein